MPFALLVLVVALDVFLFWKGAGRNHGTVTQQHVEPRRPFED